MEDYLESIEFWNSAVKTDTGFMCNSCSKEYEGFNQATVKSHTRHLGRAECPGRSYSEIIRRIFRKTYDRIPLDATDFQDMNPHNTTYALRSRTKKTGDSVPTTPHRGPSSTGKFAVRSRIEKKKKTGVSNISTHHLPPTISKYTSPMQKKIDVPMKDFNNQNNQFSGHAYKGPAGVLLEAAAPMIDGAFSEMQNMLAVFKSKLETHEDRGPSVLLEIDASFLEMQAKLDLFKSVAKSKLDTAILQCLLPPPPIA